MPLDNLRRHFFQRIRPPSGIAILVDDRGADAFDHVVPGDASERNTVVLDFRVGGTFTQKLNIRNVGEYTITGTYDEIVEPEKIVYHVNLGPATTTVTIEFVAQGNQTKIILTQVGFPDENLSRIVSEGTTESLERLEQVLSGQAV